METLTAFAQTGYELSEFSYETMVGTKGLDIWNEIVIMVKKIITMIIMMIMIINNDNTSNDIKDDKDTDNRYDTI